MSKQKYLLLAVIVSATIKVSMSCDHIEVDRPSFTACSNCSCQPRMAEQLAREFTHTHEMNTDCLELTKMEIPLGPFTSTSVYVLTGNSKCTSDPGPSYGCYNSSSDPQCTWTHRFHDFGEDFFPRYLAHVECRGSSCSGEDGVMVRRLRLLRRTGRCGGGGSGSEEWIEADLMSLNLTLICGCMRRSH